MRNLIMSASKSELAVKSANSAKNLFDQAASKFTESSELALSVIEDNLTSINKLEEENEDMIILSKRNDIVLDNIKKFFNSSIVVKDV